MSPSRRHRDEANASSSDRSHVQAGQPTSRWEWVAAGFGLVIVVACIVYLTVYAIQHPGGAPDIRLVQDAIKPSLGGYHVEIEATNIGNSTASGVVVAGTLSRDGTDIEDGEAVLDYLPQQSTRRLTLVFTQDPATHDLELRVKGFSEP